MTKHEYTYGREASNVREKERERETNRKKEQETTSERINFSSDSNEVYKNVRKRW